MDILALGLQRLGIADGAGNVQGLAGPPLTSRLRRFIDEIETFNPAYGLVKVKDRDELVIRHILDSLAPLGLIKQILSAAGFSPNAAGMPGTGNASAASPPSIADVGSGAGLPGIPLALCLPWAHLSLVERMGRRAGFLRNAAAVLGLSNVKVEEADMEKLPEGSFELVVCRAFKPLDKGLKSLLRLSNTVAVYKGMREKAEEEITVLKEAGSGAYQFEITEVKVPFLEDEERHLLVCRKACSTNSSSIEIKFSI
jgi:16S rRNA (guanine527-N7)-methyltransferase